MTALACPRDRSALEQRDEQLVCAEGHAYPSPDGIPVLVVEEIEPTQPGYWARPEQIAAVRGRRAPAAEGDRVDPYVAELIIGTHGNLYRHLAACDLAVAQGGLTTAMELTANRRPFIYFPLKHHFEQNYHVHHRLRRYGAGRRMDFDDSPPDAIPEAIAEEIAREVDYRPVETDGARRAAARLAEML